MEYPVAPPAWHSLGTDDTLARLDVTRSGLGDEAIEARRARYGANRLPPPRTPAWKRFLLQFHNVLIYVLLAAGVITALLGHAVEEGRTVYGNLKKALIFIQPTNAAQAGMVLIAILLGLTLPITPVQILWVNMVTAVTLALALAFERPEPDMMRQPPRDPTEPLLNRFMLWRIVFVAAFLVAGALGLFLWELERGMPVEVARTAAINALVMGEIFYLFNCRRLTAPVVGWSGFAGNRAVLIAIAILVVLQALFTFGPLLQTLLGTAPIDAATWLKVFVFGLVVYSVVEIEKAPIRRRASNPR